TSRRGKLFAVRTPRQGANGPAMTLPGTELPPCGDVPDVHRAVRPAEGAALAVGMNDKARDRGDGVRPRGALHTVPEFVDEVWVGQPVLGAHEYATTPAKRQHGLLRCVRQFPETDPPIRIAGDDPIAGRTACGGEDAAEVPARHGDLAPLPLVLRP